MKNLFSRKEVFSIRKFSMGVASVMIASSLVVSSQANIQLLKAKENIEVEATQEVKVEVAGGARSRRLQKLNKTEEEAIFKKRR